MSAAVFLGRSYSSPLWAASGTFGWGVEAERGQYFSPFLSAFVTKGVSPQAMLGAPQPRVSEINHGVGLLNAIGLQNPGVEAFCTKYLAAYLAPEWKHPFWINVFGSKVDDYLTVIKKVLTHNNLKENLCGFELNVSCPNVDKGGLEFASDLQALADLIRASKSLAGTYPVMVKMSPMSPAPVEVARACVGAGADALSISNTFLAGLPVVDSAQKNWALGRRFGGMSGPALKAISLRILDQVARAVEIPLCGVGGIQSAQDVKEYFSAGAQVVQLGTVLFSNPWAPDQILSGL